MGFLLGSGGGSKKTSTPTPAPAPPQAHHDKIVDALSFQAYKQLRGTTGTSYASAVLGGGAPAPKRSYTAGLFSSGAGASGV